MRTIDKAGTNKRAIEETIQLARTGLARLMPRQPTGEWHLMARWSEGKLDHLEPRYAGDDQPSEWENSAGPTGAEMRRIEQEIEGVFTHALRNHDYGRLQITIFWVNRRVGVIKHDICESRKVETQYR